MAKEIETEKKSETIRLPAYLIEEIDKRRKGIIDGTVDATRSQYAESVLRHAFGMSDFVPSE